MIHSENKIKEALLIELYFLKNEGRPAKYFYDELASEWFKNELEDVDFFQYGNSKSEWANRVQRARGTLVEDGLILSAKQHKWNEWKLSERGIKKARKICIEKFGDDFGESQDKALQELKMNYYLLTWNPDKWAWATIDQNIEELKRTGFFKDSWSCGRSKQIKKGDRLFFMRLGTEPKGISASGYASSGYYKDKHWDGTEGKDTNYVDVDFDVILKPDKDEILTLDALKSITPEKNQQWTPQQSGSSIDNEVADRLETLWFNFLNDTKKFSHSFVSGDSDTNGATDTYTEGSSYVTTMTKYERNVHARQGCLDHYGHKCSVCDFDFGNTYGDLGQGFIHVHHITPIADIGQEYQLNPIKDLRPVCPNCHAMVHRRRPALTIDKLKEKMK